MKRVRWLWTVASRGRFGPEACLGEKSGDVSPHSRSVNLNRVKQIGDLFGLCVSGLFEDGSRAAFVLLHRGLQARSIRPERTEQDAIHDLFASRPIVGREVG